MSILEQCFLNSVFGNAVNVCLRSSVLNGESAYVPEDIVVDWSLRYPARYRYARNPFSLWTILLCIAVCVCTGVHMLGPYIGPNSQVTHR